MRLSATESHVFDGIRDLKVIDAHEHLVPEARRLEQCVDFSILFAHYTQADFLAAGMPAETYQRMIDDGAMSVDEKWKVFSRFYPMIKYGSYACPARIWLRDVLGLDDLTEGNYREVSERIQADNTPGLYDRVLRHRCNIRCAIVDNLDHYAEYDMRLLRPLWRLTQYATLESVLRCAEEAGSDSTPNLSHYLDWVEIMGERHHRLGMAAVKIVSYPFVRPERDRAEAALRALPDGAADPEDMLHFTGLVYDRCFAFARRHDRTVAVHSGVWGDFRQSHPCHLIPLAQTYPENRFDLFHLGMPYVREAVMVGKMFPNVSLNLCWNTIVSPEQTVRMLDECLDLVPLNNLIVFGADYRIAVEKVYGHLLMAKEVVARVLAKRIDRGQMDLDEAARIAKLWFHDNAVQIYGLA